MIAAPARRVLLVTGLLVLFLAILLDLLQHDSLLLRAWTGVRSEPTTPAQQRLEEFQRTRARPNRP